MSDSQHMKREIHVQSNFDSGVHQNFTACRADPNSKFGDCETLDRFLTRKEIRVVEYMIQVLIKSFLEKDRFNYE